MDCIPLVSDVLDSLSPSSVEECHKTCLFSAVKQGLFGWALEIWKRLPNRILSARDTENRSVLHCIPGGSAGLVLEFFVAVLRDATDEDLRHGEQRRKHWLHIALSNRELNAKISEWIDFVPDFVIAEAEVTCDIPLLLIQNCQRGGENVMCGLERLSESGFLTPRTYYHFLAILCLKPGAPQFKQGTTVPTDEVFAAILDYLSPEAYLLKDTSQGTFLHALVRLNNVDAARLAEAIAAAPRELLSVRNKYGKTAYEFADGSCTFPKEARHLLAGSYAKGAGCS